jgi:YfiH family protein
MSDSKMPDTGKHGSGRPGPAGAYLHADWPGKPANVHAVTTLRAGGYSTGPYTSFNLAAHVEDDPRAVEANRARLAEELRLPSKPVWLNQVHRDTVIRLTHVAMDETPDADASLTRTPGLVCAVMTADCLPVFFASEAGDEVAVAHAGWRGLHGGVISSTLAAMDTRADRTLAFLGPAIGAQAFEVGEEVYQAFHDKNPQNDVAFTPSGDRDGSRRFLCDIYQLARLECTSLGIKAVSGGGMCTYSENDKFYSYRRQQTTGRMASLIWMDDSSIASK